ncbi:hypothetical protein [Betatorquevirus homini23]|uniref:DUF755 domain-containing protein n=1 Tax=TTV-like mini virus TaxID=93678 RepID=A0A1I9WIN1_9VIRU|nr:hypothetical protein QKL25_gp3 [TTV-like mini virus]APA31995.1 hypothetical protein [TTV-like mini virus]
MTLLNRSTIPCPVTSFKQLRCRIQHTPQNTTCTPSMKDKDNLHKELQSELNTTGKLKKLYSRLQNLQKKSQHKQQVRQHRRNQTRKKRRRHFSSSSSTSSKSSESSDTESSN